MDWFISDTHFGHGNVIKYSHRPFLCEKDNSYLVSIGGRWHNGVWKIPQVMEFKISKESVELMDNELIHHINSNVKANDVLWHLGDFSCRKPYEKDSEYFARCESYRERIRCRNIIICWGNHDSEVIAPLFSQCHKVVEHKFSGQKYQTTLHHYSQFVWKDSHKGSIHLYGHSHSGLEMWYSTNCPNRKAMDVGVDNLAKVIGGYRPISWTNVLEIMNERKGFDTALDVAAQAKVPREEDLC